MTLQLPFATDHSFEWNGGFTKENSGRVYACCKGLFSADLAESMIHESIALYVIIAGSE